MQELKGSLREVGMTGPFACWVRDSLDGVLVIESSQLDTSQTHPLSWAGDSFVIYVCDEPNQVVYKTAISFFRGIGIQRDVHATRQGASCCVLKRGIPATLPSQSLNFFVQRLRPTSQ